MIVENLLFAILLRIASTSKLRRLAILSSSKFRGFLKFTEFCRSSLTLSSSHRWGVLSALSEDVEELDTEDEEDVGEAGSIAGGRFVQMWVT